MWVLWILAAGIGSAIFFYVERHLAAEQRQWFLAALYRLDEDERRLTAELNLTKTIQDGFRAKTSRLRKQYQLVSLLAKTLNIEQSCRRIGDFLKTELPEIQGRLEFSCATKSYAYDVASGEFGPARGGPEGDDTIPGRVILPLVYGERKLADLIVWLPSVNAPDAPFTASDIESIRAYVGQIQMTFATAILYEESRIRAVTDALTGSAARWYFDDRLRQDIRLAQTSGQPCGLIMIDIDHFKQINDRFGHVFGDEVLRGVSAAILKTCRESDLVARYGGEEFAVIAPAINREHLIHLAERCRTAVESRTFPSPTDGTEIHATISLGVALWDKPIHADASGLIAAADKNLYAAKHAGRNRVEIR